MRPDDPQLGPTSITVGCANFEAVAGDKPATLTKILGVVAEAAGEGMRSGDLPGAGPELVGPLR